MPEIIEILEIGWQSGLEGSPRTIGIGDNSGVLALVSGIFILTMLAYRQCRRLFATLAQDLFGMRRRHNVFDPHTTNETRFLVLMGVQWCVYTGLLLYSGISLLAAASSVPASLAPAHTLAPERALADTGLLIALMAAYYVFQLTAYSTVGYTFADSTGMRLFVRCFTASQSLLGFALIVPALVAIFYPAAALAAVAVGALLYLAARITFIIKGFRIFYTNFGSLLYFILYLCTLEIIPIIFVYQMALFLVNSL